jgi:sec-independent protein translocase protein TatA
MGIFGIHSHKTPTRPSFCRIFDTLNQSEMANFLFLSLPGGMEWVIILFVVLLLFGGKKIPELMRGLGKGIREFNNARNSIESEIKDGMREADRKAIEESNK